MKLIGLIEQNPFALHLYVDKVDPDPLILTFLVVSIWSVVNISISTTTSIDWLRLQALGCQPTFKSGN